jgi:uncharacterized protein (DUF58 family)
MLGTLLMSGFAGRLSLAGLLLDFTLPEHVAARRKIASKLILRNEKSWIPSFSIEVMGAKGSSYSKPVYFPVLPANETVEERSEVYFARRGMHRENSFVLKSQFPFGFAERQALVAIEREILVYPCMDGRPEFAVILSRLEGQLDAYARGHGHDFYRIRPYEMKESARHVDWKASAHTGELQVREFAREQEPLVEIYLDMDAPNAQWFEIAVEACAYLCWQVHARPARLRFRTQNFDLMVPSEGSIYTILKYLALVEPGTRKPITGPGREDSFPVVFSAHPKQMAEAGWAADAIHGLEFPAGMGTDTGAAIETGAGS